MEKHIKLAYLYDIYGGLLTQKQRDIIALYVNEDVTVSEIAEMTSVSRQAVSELIKRIERILLSYDEKLKLFDKYIENSKICAELERVSEENYEALSLIKKLEENL